MKSSGWCVCIAACTVSGICLHALILVIWQDDAPRVDHGSAGPRHNTDCIDAAAIEFFLRGEDYYYGHGVGQDYKEAAYCYRQAAEKGHARAAEQLGYMYRDGLGVERSWNEAQKWFQKGRTD